MVPGRSPGAVPGNRAGPVGPARRAAQRVSPVMRGRRGACVGSSSLYNAAASSQCTAALPSEDQRTPDHGAAQPTLPTCGESIHRPHVPFRQSHWFAIEYSDDASYTFSNISNVAGNFELDIVIHSIAQFHVNHFKALSDFDQ